MVRFHRNWAKIAEMSWNKCYTCPDEFPSSVHTFQREQEPSRWFLEGSKVVERVTSHLIAQIVEKCGKIAEITADSAQCLKAVRASKQMMYAKWAWWTTPNRDKLCSKRKKHPRFMRNMKISIKSQSEVVGKYNQLLMKACGRWKRVSFLILDHNLVEYKKGQQSNKKGRQAGVLLSPPGK